MDFGLAQRRVARRRGARRARPRACRRPRRRRRARGRADAHGRAARDAALHGARAVPGAARPTRAPISSASASRCTRRCTASGPSPSTRCRRWSRPSTGSCASPPQKTRAPAFLRRLLLRGLRSEPAERYRVDARRCSPSCARSGAPAARRPSARAAAGAGGRLAVGAQQAGDARAAHVPGGERQGHGDLGADADGARRDAIHRAFVATGASYAEETWQRVSGLLDDYVRALVAQLHGRVRGDARARPASRPRRWRCA